MKSIRTLRRALGPVAVGCWVGAAAVGAQPEADAVSSVKAEMIRLIQSEASRLPPAAAVPRFGAVSEIDLIAPVIVRGGPGPELRFYRETPTEHFFRTGVFSRQVGPRVTTRCWTRGDAGVMLSFNW